MTLDQLTINQFAIVQDVSGDDTISFRLMEMGLVPGAEVEFVGKAPFGDPLEYRLQGYHLSLRKNEAQRILVELTSATL